MSKIILTSLMIISFSLQSMEQTKTESWQFQATLYKAYTPDVSRVLLTVDKPNITVRDLKQAIYEETGIVTEKQIIVVGTIIVANTIPVEAIKEKLEYGGNVRIYEQSNSEACLTM